MLACVNEICVSFGGLQMAYVFKCYDWVRFILDELVVYISFAGPFSVLYFFCLDVYIHYIHA
jgi:hypothetical protein